MALKNVNLPDLIERFHSDEQCRKTLEEIRWPNGVTCLKCGSLNTTPVKDRPTHVCRDCTYQFSVTVGTVLQDSKIPLYKWFLATHLMCESRKGISSNQLKRMLGLGSYRSAWYLTHRIRYAMGLVVQEELTGIIEADETFVGGKRHFDGRPGHTGPKPGSNALENKSIVLGALERGGAVRMRVAKNRTGATLKTFIDDEAGEIEALYTDDWQPYRGAAKMLGAKHETVNHSRDEWVRGDVHTNGIESVWSLLKRSVIGSYHQLSEKHLDAYLGELEWRFNNRENPYLFRDTLAALMSPAALQYKDLVAD